MSATNDPAGARASALANQPNVLVVDADLPRGGAELALEGICEVLKASVHTFLLTDRSPEKPDIVALAESFGAKRILVRPIPMLQFAEMIHEILASEPRTHPAPTDEVSERPVAPWERDPNWGMKRPEPKARTSRPVRDDPTLPPLETMSEGSIGAVLLPPEPRPGAEPVAPFQRPTAPWEEDAEWGRDSEPAASQKEGRELPPSPPPLAPPVTRAMHIRPSKEAEPEPEVPLQRQRVLNIGILRTLTKIWGRRQSGTLKAANHPGTALFADGAPADVMSEIFAKESLESTLDLTFSETRSKPNHRRPSFTSILWGAAMELAEPRFIRFNGGKALGDCAWPATLDELPIHQDIRKIAASADGYINLSDLIDAISVTDVKRVGEELSALECMGILKFAPVREAKVSKPLLFRPPEPEAPAVVVETGSQRRSGRLRIVDDLADEELRDAGLAPEQTPVSGEPSLDEEPTRDGPPRPRRARSLRQAQMELKRLRREKEHLSRADEWTVLGIPPTDNRALVKAAAARMKQRYDDLAGDDGIHDEARRIAAELSVMVERAAEMARPPSDNPLKASREDQAFLAGERAMAAKDWETAVGCFRTAYKADLDNAAFMGHLGWAMWRLAEHKHDADASKLRDDGIEMLRLSDQFDNGSDQIQLYLATAERERGEFARAEARCIRIQKREPSFPGVDMLLDEIRRAKAANTPKT